MRKPLTRPSLLAAILVAATAAVPVDAADRRFPAAGFEAVTLSTSDRVVVTAGSTASVVAAGDPVAIAALRIEVRGRTLYVDRKPGSYRDRGVTVSVTVPRLSRITLDGSGSIAVHGASGPRLAVESNGSGNISIDDLRVAETRLSLAGSGSITAAGTSPQLWIDASGSGSVDTTRVAARDVDVTSPGSSSVRARASGRAAIDSSGSGSVSVDGAADCRVSKNGSGSVRCAHTS
jgi:hypothetical protein